MAQTGFIDHIGIGVPDLEETKAYYDELMGILGLRQWFETGAEGPLNYGPDGALGSQVFFYQAEDAGTYSRLQTGLHHLAFLVASRAIVREAHEWALAREAEILDPPGRAPSVWGALLRDVLARPAWLQARGRMPPARGELPTLTMPGREPAPDEARAPSLRTRGQLAASPATVAGTPFHEPSAERRPSATDQP